MTIDSGSFRDPSGQVFSFNGHIYRSIFEHGREAYETARDECIYDHLTKKKLLIDHEEVTLDEAPEGSLYVLEHPKLSIITYPWEWPFSMLKDAALLHLDIMDELLPKRFWLRDASAFNVQYAARGIILIDTLSIGLRIPESPWVAYRQFCSHFLAPLAMAAFGDIGFMGLWRNYIDGFPLGMAAKTLPPTKRFMPGLFMHLMLHARFQEGSDKKENIHLDAGRQHKVSDMALSGIVRSLRKTISKLNCQQHSRIWADYDSVRTYEDDDVRAKKGFVKACIDEEKPEMVWDLGGNTGEFSMIAADSGAQVVSIDGDPACTDYVYNEIRKKKGYNAIYPITMDLTNPSPGLGWQCMERKSLADRGPADLLLALALIHHLLFSGNIPMDRIAMWFHSLAKNIVVEFMASTDPMIIKLTKNRPEHLPYSLDIFLHDFGKFFDLTKKQELNNGRILFFGKRK